MHIKKQLPGPHEGFIRTGAAKRTGLFHRLQGVSILMLKNTCIPLWPRIKLLIHLRQVSAAVKARIRRIFRPTRESARAPAGSLERLLGVDHRAQALELVMRIRSGLRPTAIDRLAEALAVPRSQILRLVDIAPVTFARRRQQRRLTTVEGNRVYRIAKVYEDALMLFEGDAQSAAEWMKRPLRALNGETPLQYLDTFPGAIAVAAVIARLQRGIVT